MTTDGAELATKVLSHFGEEMAAWVEYLHPDVVAEWPFGASVGLPTRVEGKEACSKIFSAFGKMGLRFTDILITPSAATNSAVAEYRSRAEVNGKLYDQRYVTILEFTDGLVSRYREYFDTAIVLNTVGNVSKMEF